MIYTAGQRPTGDDVQRIMARADLASLGREAGPDDHRLELLAGGLTFAMAGLAPGAPVPLPPARHFFGMVDSRDSFPFEAVSLAPVRRVKPGAATVPLAQTMVHAALLLAQASPVRALCWEPAAAWMDAAYFVRAIEGWLGGGAFPALGLTALVRRDDGSVVSDGLSFFIGRELQVEPRGSEHATDTVKVAVRAIDHLVREGKVTRAIGFRGPRGEPLEAEPSPDGKSLLLRRG